jgi:hypothetical protein
MNERIQQLAEQADISFDIHGDVDPQNWVDTRELEKFAELIIQECLKLLVTGEGNENTSDAIWDLEELGVSVGKLLDQIWS